MSDVAVVNASPFIFLSRADLLSLLQTVAPRVSVPAEVVAEVLAKGAETRTAKALAGAAWLERLSPCSIPRSVESWDLGPGESAVLSHGLMRSGSLVVLDDLQARRCAASLGLPTIGTLGLVLRAKRRGVVPAARPVVEQLVEGGMYLSRKVVDQALSLVDE